MFREQSSLESREKVVDCVANDPEFMYWSKVLAEGSLELSEAADLSVDMWELMQRQHGVDSSLREDVFETAQSSIQLKEFARGEA